MAQRDALVGRTVQGVHLLELVGAGATGRVYRAHHSRLDIEVAAKILVKVEPRTGERFRREGLAMARVVHPNVARVLDLGALELGPGAQVLCMFQEFVAGRDLETLVAEEEPLPPARALEIAEGIAKGLVALHETGVVHRDVKPSNVVLTEGGTPKLVDFGLARELTRRSDLTQAGSSIGTPLFAAPEMLEYSHSTPAADCFGLGAALFFMLAGSAPHYDEGEHSAFVQVLAQRLAGPPADLAEVCEGWRELEELLASLLQPDPSARLTSSAAQEAIARLRAQPRTRRRAPVVSRRGASGRLSQARERRSGAPTWLGLAGLAGLALVGSVALSRAGRQPEQLSASESPSRPAQEETPTAPPSRAETPAEPPASPRASAPLVGPSDLAPAADATPTPTPPPAPTATPAPSPAPAPTPSPTSTPTAPNPSADPEPEPEPEPAPAATAAPAPPAASPPPRIAAAQPAGNARIVERPRQAQPTCYVWWEAEAAEEHDFDNKTLPLRAKGKERISGQAWLNGKLPTPRRARYRIELPYSGRYQLYMRRFWYHGDTRLTFAGGVEVVRAGRDYPLLDPVKLDRHSVHWVDCGELWLERGAQVVELQATKRGKTTLAAYDCFVLCDRAWSPRGKQPPELSQEPWQDWDLLELSGEGWRADALQAQLGGDRACLIYVRPRADDESAGKARVLQRRAERFERKVLRKLRAQLAAFAGYRVETNTPGGSALAEQFGAEAPALIVLQPGSAQVLPRSASVRKVGKALAAAAAAALSRQRGSK